jgi:hypothetical protein
LIKRNCDFAAASNQAQQELIIRKGATMKLQALALAAAMLCGTAAFADSDLYVNHSVKNIANDSGNGSQNAPTTGVDYGIGPNYTGPNGNVGLAYGTAKELGQQDRLRSHTAGFAPHHKRYMIYDNQLSVHLPAVR